MFLGCSDPSDQCIETVTALGALTAKSPGGVEGTAFLARAGSAHKVRLSEDPAASRDDVKTSGVRPGATADLSIVPAGGDYQIVQSRVQECFGRACNPVGLVCLDRLELPVLVSLKSEDGVFNEDWNGLLTATAPSDPELKGQVVRAGIEHSAWLQITLDKNNFKGAFRVLKVQAPENYTLEEHSMQLVLRFDSGRFVEGKIVSILDFHSEKKRLQLRETDLWIRPR